MTTTARGGLGPTPPTLGRISLRSAALILFLLCGLLAPASAESPTRLEHPASDPVHQASELESRIDAAADLLWHEKEPGTVSDEQCRETIQFIMGNMLFVLLHETGHVMITEMGLPVLGREEDAADSFATVMILAMKTMFTDRVLTAAAQGWFYSDRRDRTEHAPLVFYDAHSLDRQRAYQIVCLMVGSDPEKFAQLADSTGLPPDRQSTCQGDFSNAEWSWTRLLKDHLRTTQPRTELTVRYGDPTPALELYARVMKETRLLETVAQRLSEKYAWRAPFTLEAKTCGGAGADWNLETRTVTLCYEMAEQFSALYSRYGAMKNVAQTQP